jgi:hypothetical protein
MSVIFMEATSGSLDHVKRWERRDNLNKTQTMVSYFLYNSDRVFVSLPRTPQIPEV